MSVEIADIEKAAAVVAGHVVVTPATPSITLAEVTGAASVVVKFENLQFTASFKERGARNRLAALTEDERRQGVIAVSAGNHAQGVARHASLLGIPATIVMPATTPFTKVEHTAALGAEVVLAGEDLTEARVATDRLREERALVPIHPYDDPLVIAGQGTVGLELADQAPDLEVVVVPIGGGGLISGIAVALADRLPGCEVVGVQSAACPSMRNAISEGPPLPTPGGTLADGIAVKEPGVLTTAIVGELVSEILLVGEDAIERAVAMYVEIEKTVAEGAAAACLAAMLEHPAHFAGRRVGLVLSGGNIDSRLLASVLQRNMVREGRIAELVITIDDRPGQLAAVTHVLGDAGVNILEVHHQRLSLDLPARRATVEVLIETRDRAHTTAVTAALSAAGFGVTVRPG
jgi:threonine dehydratase